MKIQSQFRRTRAFSLVELLVVVAVIAIIAGFAVPAVTTMIRGSQLTEGSQLLTDQLALARQTALSKSHSLEVRFYKFGDPETPGEDPSDYSTGFYRAFQTFEILENGAALPLGKIQRLPSGVIMNEDKYSSLIICKAGSDGAKANKPTEADPAMPDEKTKRNYRYVSFRFLPDGSTDLSTTGTPAEGPIQKNDSWFITLHGANVKTTDITTTNYFTLQVDPVTGSTRAYRPTVQ
jgi:uncharacterized protein (TIGR02596 family)